MKKRHQQKLVVLALFLTLALNIPFLLIFDKQQHFLGFPLIYAYIFSVWLFAIIISYVILNKYFE